MTKNKYVLACLWLLFLIPPARADYVARVVGITDGDTIKVLTQENREVKIRLYGIDAPEKKQDFGSVAKHAASYLAFGKEVTVQYKATDRYGRMVAEVKLPDGSSLNELMVETGMAWWYRKYAPHDAKLEKAEEIARKGKVGLWSHPNPVAPWEFRKQQRRTL